jgi:V-type H+-transporting ATPase proteolipid subunit
MTFTDFLDSSSPYLWAWLGVGLSLGLTVLGSAWGIFTTSVTLVGAVIRKPEIGSKNLISVLFCEAIAIYGVVLAVLMMNKIGITNDTEASPQNLTAAFAMFWSGLGAGISNLSAGFAVGILGSGICLASAVNRSMFVKLFIALVFAEAIAIMAVITCIMCVTAVSID